MAEWSLDEAGRAALREAAVDLYRAQAWIISPLKGAEELAREGRLPPESAGLHPELIPVHDLLWFKGIKPILAYLKTEIGGSADDPKFADLASHPGTEQRLAGARGFISKANESLVELVREAPGEHALRAVAASVSEIDQELGQIIERHPAAFEVMDRVAAEPEPEPRPASRPAASPPATFRWPWRRDRRGRGSGRPGRKP